MKVSKGDGERGWRENRGGWGREGTGKREKSTGVMMRGQRGGERRRAYMQA